MRKFAWYCKIRLVSFCNNQPSDTLSLSLSLSLSANGNNQPSDIYTRVLDSFPSLPFADKHLLRLIVTN